MPALQHIQLLTLDSAWANRRLFDLPCQIGARPPVMDLPVFLRDGEGTA